jgi:hypothetical protein
VLLEVVLHGNGLGRFIFLCLNIFSMFLVVFTFMLFLLSCSDDISVFFILSSFVLSEGLLARMKKAYTVPDFLSNSLFPSLTGPVVPWWGLCCLVA